ncbi:MAG: riboflavin synthase [Deltaproteobacteria bacterium]|nr:riboflavin synthase [Deltaproteobacteria bacterium]
MFTGLIRDIGKIQSIERRGGGIRLTISTHLDLSQTKIGDSISVDGACLTVVKLSGHIFTMDVSPETRQRTTLSAAMVGQEVNLEMPLKMSDPLGGHLVSGHVDGTGEIVETTPQGNSTRYRFRVPVEISRYLIEKGSVAVDGISLTITECQDQEFSVNIIPHTAQATTLGRKKVGDRVNIESDLIAKYVEKFVRRQEGP